MRQSCYTGYGRCCVTLSTFLVSACHLKITHWGSIKVCWRCLVQHKKSKACVTGNIAGFLFEKGDWLWTWLAPWFQVKAGFLFYVKWSTASGKSNLHLSWEVENLRNIFVTLWHSIREICHNLLKILWKLKKKNVCNIIDHLLLTTVGIYNVNGGRFSIQNTR